MPRLPDYDPEGSADNFADRLENPEYGLGAEDEEGFPSRATEDMMSPLPRQKPHMPEGRPLTNNEKALRLIEQRRMKKLNGGRSILNKAPKRRR